MTPLRQFLSIALSALAAACASSDVRTPEHYERGAASAAQFQKDASLCDKQAESDQKQLGYGPYDPSQGTYNRMFDACMRASGYSLKAPK
jgi:hypothetical protein